MSPIKNGALRGMGEPTGMLVVIDPGKRTGVAVYDPGTGYAVNTAGLDELPALLHELLPGPVFVACEDFHLTGGRAMQQSGSDMPSSRGIGMCQLACEWTDTPLILVQPGVKRAGFKALDADGLAARAACRNDHERDVVDLTGYVLREMRR